MMAIPEKTKSRVKFGPLDMLAARKMLSLGNLLLEH